MIDIIYDNYWNCKNDYNIKNCQMIKNILNYIYISYNTPYVRHNNFNFILY